MNVFAQTTPEFEASNLKDINQRGNFHAQIKPSRYTRRKLGISESITCQYWSSVYLFMEPSDNRLSDQSAIS